MAARLRADLRLAARLLALLCLVLPSLVQAVFLACVNVVAPRLGDRIQPTMMRFWFRSLARVWNLEIESRGRAAPAPALVACNHRSWLDIVALGSRLSGAFVAKAEIDRWPLVGYLSRHGGRTLYITRGEMRSFKALGGQLIGRLRAGERVVFFPEGGVSGDKPLKRFRPRLFAAAIAARCPVQPVALAYVGDDGGRRAPMKQDELCFFHALRMLRCRHTEVRLDFLAPLDTADTEAKALAARAQGAVAAALGGAAASALGEFADTLGAVEREARRDG